MTFVLKIEESDYQSLDSFPLKWRWTDSRWNRLPDDALNDILPLRGSKAHELCQYSAELSDQTGLIASSFDPIARIETSGDESEIRQWLLDRSSNLNQGVVVSWDNNLAIFVDWRVFCEYWDDFCYPSSDDVAIFPLSEKWMLFYSHDEYFMFGDRRTNGAA